MEFILKDCKCEHCEVNGLDGSILVLNYKNFVDYGICVSCLRNVVLPQEKYHDFVKQNCVVYNSKNVEEKKEVLECSTKGDKRFSALCSKVYVNGVLDTIENHYQKSKVFIDSDLNYIQYDDLKKSKGKKPIGFKINGCILPLRFGSQYYKLLWYKYLKGNKDLENVLVEFKDYNDTFKSVKSYVCQADVIRDYMQDKNGIKYNPEDRGQKLYSDCKELLDFLNKKVSYVVEKGDIFKGIGQIIGHQVNCQGAMGKGIAKTIRDNYREVYNEYVLMCKQTPKEELLGKCQIVDCGTKYIANLFGQRYWGRDRFVEYTNKDALKKALIELKEYGKKNNLLITLPYGIGCCNANSKWKEIEKIINDVFKDYYLILYNYN